MGQKDMRRAMLAGIAGFALLGPQVQGAETFPKITPDPAQVERHMDAARKLAGTDLAESARIFCLPVTDIVKESVAYAEKGPPAAPTRIFDNLYYLGTRYVDAYALVTSEGIILIDALDNWDEAKTNIEDGLAKFGLKASDIKLVLISHAGDDHYGGAKYFQEKYGAHVGMTAGNWDQTEAGFGKRPGHGPAPVKDKVIKDGEKIVMGGTTLTLLDTGGLSQIFNVTDHGQRHMVSVWGTIATGPGDMSFQTERGLAHYKQYTVPAKVDVLIANHPYVNHGIDLNDAINAGHTRPNPYVLGAEKFERTMDVYKECALAARYRPPFTEPFAPQGFMPGAKSAAGSSGK